MAWAKCNPCELTQYWPSSNRSGLAKWCCSQCGGRLVEAETPDYAIADKHRVLASRGICPRAAEKWVYSAQRDNPEWKKRMRGSIERYVSHLVESGWGQTDQPYCYDSPEGKNGVPLPEAIEQQEQREQDARIQQKVTA